VEHFGQHHGARSVIIDVAQRPGKGCRRGGWPAWRSAATTPRRPTADFRGAWLLANGRTAGVRRPRCGSGSSCTASPILGMQNADRIAGNFALLGRRLSRRSPPTWPTRGPEQQAERPSASSAKTCPARPQRHGRRGPASSRRAKIFLSMLADPDRPGRGPDCLSRTGGYTADTKPMVGGARLKGDPGCHQHEPGPQRSEPAPAGARKGYAAGQQTTTLLRQLQQGWPPGWPQTAQPLSCDDKPDPGAAPGVTGPPLL